MNHNIQAIKSTRHAKRPSVQTDRPGVVVGDGAVGKTCLLISYTTNAFPGECLTTTRRKYSSTGDRSRSDYGTRQDRKTMMCAESGSAVDVPGRADVQPPATSVVPANRRVPGVLLDYAERGRTAASTQLVFLRYQLTIQKWIPEIRHHAAGVPIILVGTKLDLRDDPTTIQRLRERRFSPITYNQGMQMAKEVGAVRYVEASSKTQEGLKNVFDEAIRAVLTPADRPAAGQQRKPKKKVCTIL
ncbi:rho GTPase [Trichosporon asahii var. asahii CBS 8904]|uniref:Rho GTPase n=1 Tax=Trichosporon asahii var. asahii (strain CBS 8904) TaxID=1220162 RepID=K1VL53_TRIAC|nr:rho GTPase [Trichosporon asahii var. asahii CBS 8904]